jgi:spore maturation protein CgeB
MPSQEKVKVLIISTGVEGGWAATFERSFRELGHPTTILDDQRLYRNLSLLQRNRYFHHFFWRILALPLQKKIIGKTIKEKPDLILILKGWLIQPQTIIKIKKSLPNTLIFNYNPDNPFNSWAHGNSNSWVRKSIPLYDTYFIWGKFLQEPILKAGAKRFEYLPCGYDPKLHYPVKVSAEQKEIFGSDIAFVGTYDEERKSWLNQLLDYDLKIWGNSWEKAGKNLQKKWQKREVVGEDFSKVCNSAKILLNFLRKQNGSAHNMRTFEIPACGGFELATRTEEHVGFFKEGKEMDFFSSPGELKQKIDFYLANPELREKIAGEGHKKVMGTPSTYKDRAARIIEVYEDLAR